MQAATRSQTEKLRAQIANIEIIVVRSRCSAGQVFKSQASCPAGTLLIALAV
eukprot:m.54862 g.54862  ORF g.54862 m.54862 type:complete len:52 (+) comp9219_c0_seq3:1081-1236(+)